MKLIVDFISGANRLPNGNTLICSGPNGHLIELDSADNIVWEYINPIEGAGVRLSQGSIPSNNPLFRAYRYSPNHPAFANRTLTPNGYLELNSTPNCVLYNNSSNIGELTEELKVKVIQNPFRDFLSIANKNNETLSIKVFNLMGTLMFDSQSSAAKIEIETSNWSNQIYIVLIQSGHKMYQRKVLKI